MKVDWRAILITVALWICVQAIPYNIYDPDLEGSYCASRPKGGCCPGRQDGCSAPIRGTLCYCDDFCNRTSNDDCCPDFWSHCKGIQRPTAGPEETRTCYFQNQYFSHGEKFKANCNECECKDNNGQMDVLCETNDCIIDDDIISRINQNSREYGWQASNYSEFWGKQLEEGLAKRLGTLHSKKKVSSMKPLKLIYDPNTLPRSFDARTKWPGLITQPIDQTDHCAASWAVSTAAVASDRYSVMTKHPQTLAPQHLLSCNSKSQEGCKGGHLTRAWIFIGKFGLVPESCYPWVGAQTECRVSKKRKLLISKCPQAADFHQSEWTPLFRVGPVYKLDSEKDVMHDIMTSGPVQATMKVSREFFLYKSGIYRCSGISPKRTGYHAVRIIGWGIEVNPISNKEEKFWIASNSWGTSWGEGGYFRIRRGSNECEIESFVIAAWAGPSDVNRLIDKGIYDIEAIVRQAHHNSSDVRNDLMRRK